MSLADLIPTDVSSNIAIAICAHVTMLRRIVIHPDVTLTARLIAILDSCAALFASLVAIHIHGRGTASLDASAMLIARLIMRSRRRVVRRTVGPRFI